MRVSLLLADDSGDDVIDDIAVFIADIDEFNAGVEIKNTLPIRASAGDDPGDLTLAGNGLIFEADFDTHFKGYGKLFFDDDLNSACADIFGMCSDGVVGGRKNDDLAREIRPDEFAFFFTAILHIFTSPFCGPGAARSRTTPFLG